MSRPREATSVATRTLNLPSLKPAGLGSKLTFESDLSLRLGNVTVEHLGIDLDSVRENDLVCVRLGLGEDDGFPVEAAVTHH